MLNTRKFCYLAIVSILFLAGCSQGIKEGYHSLMGSSGKTVLLSGDKDKLSHLALEYGSVQVEPFTNDVGPSCPQAFLDNLPQAISDQLKFRPRSVTDTVTLKKKEEMGPFFTGPSDKILLIKGKVIQYDIGSTVDKVTSPLDEAICRVQILDKSSNTLLAEVNCTGRVKSALRSGPIELAKGIGKSVNKLLKPAKENSAKDKDAAPK
jgi:hypothetical protein